LRLEIRGRSEGARLYLIHEVKGGIIRVWLETESVTRKWPYVKRKMHKKMKGNPIFIYQSNLACDTAWLVIYLSLVDGEIPLRAAENLLVLVVARAAETDPLLRDLLDFWGGDSNLRYGALISA